MNNSPTLDPVTSAPRLERGRPVYDNRTWIRLPRAGSRCPVSNLSRSTLAELVRPCLRNEYRPPVEARLLKRKGATRGVLLISRESLLDFVNDLPPPESATSPTNIARAAAAAEARLERECLEIAGRPDLTAEAKRGICADIRSGRLRASDIEKEVTP